MHGAESPAFEGSERYAIRRPIGGGAMGLVYEAWDRERKAAVALKTLRTGTPEALYRLKQEFRALADLSHPNLVRLYELVGSEENWFIVMEMVEGQRFLNWLRGEGLPEGISASWPTKSEGMIEGETPPSPEPSLPPDLDRVRQAIVQLVRGLAALHAAGKLHRDLKPSNVLVTAKGRVVLVDFGLVYDVDRAASELSRIDKVVGTAAYMAPEQARGETPTEASDLYCVGVMLYQALTGRLPFEGNLVRILYRKQNEDPPPPSTLLDGIPEDLDDLCTALLARDAEARPTAAEVIARLGEDPDATDDTMTTGSLKRLEGREIQRQALEDNWARARSGRATLMHVRGRSGMGKTGLVRHFCEEVRKHEDVTVLRGRCWEREQVPFKAWDNLVDGLRRRLHRMDREARTAVLPEDIGALARLFPVLEAFVPEDAPDSAAADPADLRARAFTAFAALLANMSRRRPVIAFLDDVQWADVDSARLLSALLRDLREEQILFILAYRTEDEDASAFLVDLEHDPTVAEVAPRVLDVDELPEDTATAVARSLLADGLTDPSGAAVWLAREARGSPFLMAELATALNAAVEHGQEQPDLARFTVDDLYRQRVESLDPPSRRLMEAIALAGRPLPLRLVARAADVEEDLLDSVDPLRARHLVRSTRGPLGDLVEPYHARIAAAVVGGLEREARCTLHLRLAQAMESQGWLDPEVLMEHFGQGGERERAGLLALQAARGASDTLAFGRAADLYHRALDLRDWSLDERQVIEEELADALVYAGRGEEAARAYLEVAAAMPPDRALPPRRKAGEQLIFAGRVSEGLGLLDEVVVQTGLQLPPASPLWTMIRTWWARIWARRRPIEFDPVPEHEIPRDVLQRMDTAWHLSLGLGLVDPVQCGWYHARSLRLALDAKEPYRAARALAIELPQAVAWGQSSPEIQARQMRRARQLATLSGRAHATGLVDFGEGVVAYQEGRWDAARRALNRAHRVFVEQCAGVPFEVAATRLYAVKALIWSGRLVEAADRRHRLLREASELGNRFLADGLQTDVCVWVPLSRGDGEEVRTALDEVLARWSRRIWDERRLLAFTGELERLLWEGRAADAWTLLLAHEPEVYQAQLHRLSVNRRRLAELRGRIALSLALDRGDLRLVKEARRSVRRLARGRAASPPLGHVLEAGARALLGDREGAVDALRLAARGFEQAGMALHEAIAQARLGELLEGEEGERAAALATQYFERERVTRPEDLTRLLAPGFGRRSSAS